MSLRRSRQWTADADTIRSVGRRASVVVLAGFVLASVSCSSSAHRRPEQLSTARATAAEELSQHRTVKREVNRDDTTATKTERDSSASAGAGGSEFAGAAQVEKLRTEDKSTSTHAAESQGPSPHRRGVGHVQAELLAQWQAAPTDGAANATRLELARRILALHLAGVDAAIPDTDLESCLAALGSSGQRGDALLVGAILHSLGREVEARRLLATADTALRDAAADSADSSQEVATGNDAMRFDPTTAAGTDAGSAAENVAQLTASDGGGEAAARDSYASSDANESNVSVSAVASTPSTAAEVAAPHVAVPQVDGTDIDSDASQPSAVSQPAPPPFAVSALSFAESIGGPGEFIPLPPHRIVAGVELLLYGEFENFTTHAETEESGQETVFVRGFSATLRLLGPHDEVLDELEFLTPDAGRQVVDDPNEPVNFWAKYEIPKRLSTGVYRVRVTAQDLLSGAEGNAELQFGID